MIFIKHSITQSSNVSLACFIVCNASAAVVAIVAFFNATEAAARRTI